MVLRKSFLKWLIWFAGIAFFMAYLAPVSVTADSFLRIARGFILVALMFSAPIFPILYLIELNRFQRSKIINQELEKGFESTIENLNTGKEDYTYKPKGAGLFYQAGATKIQKIVTNIFFILLVGPAFFVFTGNFVYTAEVSKLSNYFSLILTVSAVSVLVHLFFKKKWKPGENWYSQTKIEKTLQIPLILLLIHSLFWINLAISGPHLYTFIFGVSGVKQDTVIKDRNFNRRSCDYELKPKNIDIVFFQYCITRDLYNQLPEGDIKSELIVKQSSLGYIVKDIRVLVSRDNFASREADNQLEQSIWLLRASFRIFLVLVVPILFIFYLYISYSGKTPKDYQIYRGYLAQAMERFRLKEYESALEYFEKAKEVRSLEPTNEVLYERCKKRAAKGRS